VSDPRIARGVWRFYGALDRFEECEIATARRPERGARHRVEKHALATPRAACVTRALTSRSDDAARETQVRARAHPLDRVSPSAPASASERLSQVVVERSG